MTVTSTAVRAMWATATLGEVCDVAIGRTPAREKGEYWGPGSPWLTISDMNQGRDLETTAETITELAMRECKCRLVPVGTVVLSFKLSIGKVGVIRRPLCTNEAIAALPIRDTSRLIPDFLYWALRSTDLTIGRDRAAKGLTLNREKLLRIRIPLPPLPDQRRIADIMDKADALRAKRRAALAQLDTLTQSTFLELFGEKLEGPAVDTRPHCANVPKGCSWVLLTDVARLATGHTPDRERPEYWNGEIPWISLTDIRSLDGTEATSTLQNVTPLGIENSSSVLLPKGTVCFSRTASVGFVTVMGREMATSQDFMNWVCGPLLDPTYLMWALITSRQRLLSLAPGSTHHTIYMRVVEQFRVLLPPIEAQLGFASRVAGINDLKKWMHASLAELDHLFASLQHRAFRGEL